MSDSLLNLLEVLNEVLEEQGLQEQASGGAPTEQELWNIISPGLGGEKGFIYRYFNNWIEQAKKRDSYEKYRTIRSTVDNAAPARRDSLNKSIEVDTSFVVAFGSIEQQISSGEADIEKIRDISSWLLRLNNYYISNPLKPVIQNTIFDSMSEGQSLAIKPDKPLRRNTKLIYALMQEIDPAFKTTVQQTSAFMFDNLIANLKKGMPTFGFKKDNARITGVLPGIPASLAPHYKTFDLLDFEKLVELAKKGDFSYTKSVLNHTASIKNEKFKILYSQIIQEYYEKIFMHYLKNTEEAIKNSKSLRDTLSDFSGRVTKKGEKGTVPQYPEHVEFIKKWNGKFYAKYLDIFKKTQASGEPGLTVTNPQIKTSSGFLSEDFINTLDIFFEGELSFSERINIFNEKISIFALPKEEFQNSIKDEKKVKDVLDFTNRIFVMDYFIQFTKGFGSVASGLLFEYFLAGLAGGKVVGQRGDAVDFEADGVLGSAKFVSLDVQGTLRQSITAFEKKLNKEITYIVGVKKPSEFNLVKNSVAPLEIQEVDVYTFKIKYLGDSEFETNTKSNKVSLIRDKKKKVVAVDFSILLSTLDPETTIKIMSTDKNGIKTYRQTLDAMLENKEDDTANLERQVLNKVKEIFDNIKGGESDARNYAQTGDKQKGQSAMKQLYDSREAISSLSGISAIYNKLPEPNDA